MNTQTKTARKARVKAERVALYPLQPAAGRVLSAFVGAGWCDGARHELETRAPLYVANDGRVFALVAASTRELPYSEEAMLADREEVAANETETHPA